MPSYVIAGASRGLGYEYLRQLSQDKSNIVVGLVRNKTGTDERLAKDGITNVTILQADITDYATLQAAAEDVSKLVGDAGVDYLINNAVRYSDHELKDLAFFEDKPDELKKSLEVTFESNVIAVASTITAFLPLVKKSKTKKIIAISTGMADIDLINEFKVGISAAYAVSKNAVSTLIAKYNCAYASQGILFMSISPGFVDTSEGKQMSEEELALVGPMIESFAKYKPGFTGPITPKESVEHVLKLVHRATIEEFGGKFVSHFGNKQWL